MSAKYPYFGKKGRPSKVERDICKKINDLVDNGTIDSSELESFVNKNGQAMTQDELENLYSFMTGETPLGTEGESVSKNQNQTGANDSPEFDDTDFEQTSNVDGLGGDNNMGGANHNGIGNPDAVHFDPFKEPVVERAYTKGEFINDDIDAGGVTGGESQPREGVKLEEDDFGKPNDDTESVASEVGGGSAYNETQNNTGSGIDDAQYAAHSEEEDIPEAQWNNTTEEEEEALEEELREPKEPLGGDNLQELSPAQKRKAAEKTADAILQMYCKFAPLPFKNWASFSDAKIQKLALEGRIDLNMPLENGVTVKDFIDGHNEQVDEIFDVDEETQAEIRDPLIDVLMEQELALTPTQRLLMAVGSHVVTMGFSAYKLASSNKQSLEVFEKYHTDLKSSGYVSKSPVAQQHTETSSRASSNSAPKYNSQEFTSSDRTAVEQLMREINSEESDIIDPEHDSSVTVEEV